MAKCANLLDEEISELKSLIGLYEEKIEILRAKTSNKTRGQGKKGLMLESGQFENIIQKGEAPLYSDHPVQGLF